MPDSMDVRRLHGRTGKIRFQLGYAPLAVQGIRKVRQALQKYYKM
jgi:putative peptide zinc metalloprotease protein